MDRGDISLFACRAGAEFGNRLCRELDSVYTKKKDLKGFRLGKSNVVQFADGEIKAEILENVRGMDVFLVQSLANKAMGLSVNENLVELLVFVDALRRAKASKITLVVPYMAYSRQDKTRGREPITAKLLSKLIRTAGADGLITMDLHADQIEGFYDIDIDNLHASKLIIDYLVSSFKDVGSWVFASPDAGGAARAEHYAKKLNASYAISSKRRNYCKADSVEETYILGDVRGKTVCIVDDVISTAGTLESAAREMHKKGAGCIYAAITHALFNETATERLSRLHNEGILKAVICIDTVMPGKGFALENPWYVEVSAAALLARAIHNINRCISVSTLYG